MPSILDAPFCGRSHPSLGASTFVVSARKIHTVKKKAFEKVPHLAFSNPDFLKVKVRLKKSGFGMWNFPMVPYFCPSGL